MMRSATTGYNVIPVNLTALNELFGKVNGKVGYWLNAKPRAGAKPGTFKLSDCSGFVRWLLPLICTEHIDIPDGSVHQRLWCAKQGFKLTSYKTSAPLKDGRLRIAFIRPKGRKVGHVWLVLNGHTMESYGGHGIGRRLYSEGVLMRRVSDCFVLTDPLD